MTAFWIMFLFHIQLMGLFEMFIKPPHIVQYKFLWPFILSIGIIMAWLSYRLKSHNTLLNRIANVFFLCSISVIIINTGFTIFSTINRLSNDYKKQEYLKKVESNKRDIVWILMDAYSNSSFLKSIVNFKNPIDSILTHQGFHVLNNIRSRSDATLYSVNSVFNFDDPIKPYNFNYGLYSAKYSALPRILNEINYKFISLSFFDIGQTHRLLDIGGYSTTLLYKLIDGTICQLLMRHYFEERYRKMVDPFPLDKLGHLYNEIIIDTLNKSVSKKYSKPAYIWAHLLIPHYPFYRLENKKLMYVHLSQGDTSANKKAYIDYLSYGNQVVLDLLKSHPEMKNKIVIISGDHGARFSFLKNDDDHRFRPFCAVYMPPGVDTTGINKINYISELPAFILKSQIVKTR
jgi:hypothetical protein